MSNMKFPPIFSIKQCVSFAKRSVLPATLLSTTRPLSVTLDMPLHLVLNKSSRKEYHNQKLVTIVQDDHQNTNGVSAFGASFVLF